MKTILKRAFSLVMIMAIVGAIFITDKVETKAAEPDYSAIFNAEYYSNTYADLKAAFGTNEKLLLNHFLNAGIYEGRQGCADFNVFAYRNRYADLKAAYGDNLKMYYVHYMMIGKAEGRSGKADATTPAKTTVTPVTTVTPSTTANTSLPANAMKHGNGYFLPDVGPAVFSWISGERAKAKVRTITWADGMQGATYNRAKEISIVYSSGRPDGTPWQTAYTGYGDIKEMFFTVNGVATPQDVEYLISYNTDRMRYITTDKFDKCSIGVYTEGGKSYVIIAFSKLKEEENK